MAEKALIIRTAGALPAIVAQAPEHARVRFLEFFAAAIRNPKHAASLCARGGRVSRVVRAGRREVHDRGAAAARGGLDRAANTDAVGLDRQAAPGRDSPPF